MGKLIYKIGNLLEGEQKIIAHQVSCQGVMGSGVAKQIKEVFPTAYNCYVQSCRGCEDKEELLGYAEWVSCQKSNQPHVVKIVVNIFGQLNYGYNGARYTNYPALFSGLKSLCNQCIQYGYREFAIPYKMGCDRGGGNWDFVAEYLKDLTKMYNIDIYIYKL